MAEEKEEKIKIVEPGRENDKLTKMAEGVYKTIDELQREERAALLSSHGRQDRRRILHHRRRKDDSQRVQGAHRISRSIQKSFKLDKEVTTWKKK